MYLHNRWLWSSPHLYLLWKHHLEKRCIYLLKSFAQFARLLCSILQLLFSVWNGNFTASAIVLKDTQNVIYFLLRTITTFNTIGIYWRCLLLPPLSIPLSLVIFLLLLYHYYYCCCHHRIAQPSTQSLRFQWSLCRFELKCELHIKLSSTHKLSWMKVISVLVHFLSANIITVIKSSDEQTCKDINVSYIDKIYLQERHRSVFLYFPFSLLSVSFFSYMCHADYLYFNLSENFVVYVSTLNLYCGDSLACLTCSRFSVSTLTRRFRVEFSWNWRQPPMTQQ